MTKYIDQWINKQIDYINKHNWEGEDEHQTPNEEHTMSIKANK